MTDELPYNFLTMGYDCSPASALKNLGLRKHALPFDWVESSIYSLRKCFETDFNNFHSNVILNHKKTRIIDGYYFQFPHDYPTLPYVGNTSTGENIIVSDWASHYPTVKEKYERRIARFRNIVNDPKPIIVLCRYQSIHVAELKELFSRFFNKTNVVFINAAPDEFSSGNTLNINPDKNGGWNDPGIWKEGIDKAVSMLFAKPVAATVNIKKRFAMVFN